MKKIALLLGSAILLAGCFHAGTPTGNPQSQTNEFTGSLMDAMRRNLPMKCTWTDGADTGEAYVKGEMMYSQTTTDGQTTYTIRKDGCNYIWGEQVDQAVKVCMDLTASMAPVASGFIAPTTGEVETQGPDLNVSYRCLPTVVSDDKFNPPADIQFTDLGAMMDKMMQSMPALPSMPAIPGGY